jgi:hypothetical protein
VGLPSFFTLLPVLFIFFSTLLFRFLSFDIRSQGLDPLI